MSEGTLGGSVEGQSGSTCNIRRDVHRGTHRLPKLICYHFSSYPYDSRFHSNLLIKLLFSSVPLGKESPREPEMRGGMLGPRSGEATACRREEMGGVLSLEIKYLLAKRWADPV